jgi:uncharacterized protein YecE (DUF72 family)
MITMNPIHIGLSGYSYKPWQGVARFYPEKLKSAEFLRYYAGRFKTVELDGMWYRLPTEQMVHGWLDQTPSSFIFSPKAHRQITHMHRLRPDALAFVHVMLDRLAPLMEQKRLGPVLLQLPPNFRRDDDRLKTFLEGATNGAVGTRVSPQILACAGSRGTREALWRQLGSSGYGRGFGSDSRYR